MSEEPPKKRGILDPWRIVEPLKAPPRTQVAPNTKINPSDYDFDAVLRMAQYYVFRSMHGSVEVRSKNLNTVDDALHLLVSCLRQLTALPTLDALCRGAGLGASLGEFQLNMPTSFGYSCIQTHDTYQPKTVLYFHNQSYDTGMLGLVRLLNYAQRTNGAILKHWGVTPLMR